MKQTRLLLLFVCITGFANIFAANRYWVGGAAGTWDASTTTCWSETSGGTSGASVPVAGDDVIFDNSTNANSTSNANPTVTLNFTTGTPALKSITFTSSNVTFAGAKTITTTDMTVDNSQVAFVSVVTINSALTFSSTSGTTTTPRFSHSSAAGSAITLGNGGAFTLTGNSATNYFTGTTNSSFRYNTSSALTVFFKAGITISGIYVYKGLITVGNNLALPRLNFPPANLNNQELIVAPNVTLTLSGGASSGYTELAGGGTINASASGSKVLITQTAPSAGNYNSLNTAGRIFKANTTINNLEVNTTGNLVLGFPITVRTLTKTAGTITTNSTNTITIAAGGNVVEGTGTVSGTAVITGSPLTRYWVGTTAGNWLNAASWGTSSGNLSTPGVPEYGDNVVFDNTTGNENPTVTLTDHVTAADINFTGSNVTFAGADSIKTNSMTLNSSQVQFVDHVRVNSSLTFLGTNPRITQLSTTSGRAFIFGNGGAFILNGNSTNNYFTGNTNAYYTFNTTSPLTVYFNPTTTTAGALVVKKGLISLGNSVNTNRITLNDVNSQELIVGTGATLGLVGAGTSSFTNAVNGGVINAIATDSKVLITSIAPTILGNQTTSAAIAGRIFKDGSTINHLEYNSAAVFYLPFAMTVKNLTLTGGQINNTTNNITIPSGGNLVVGAGTTTAALSASLPSAPTIGIATAGNAQAAVAFTAPANGGSLITGYTVTPYVGASAGTPVTSNTNPVVVTGLTNGTTYTFKVKANNGVGASAESAPTDLDPPVVPHATNNIIAVSAATNVSDLGITPVSDVVVSGNVLTINQATTVSSLTVAPGAKVTVSGTNALTATNGITLQSNAGNTATLVDNYADPTITATVEQYLPQGRNWYVASPIESNIATSANLTGAGASSVSYYSEELGWQHNYAGNLAEGVGYIAVSTVGSNTNKINFNGKLNSGDVLVTLTRKATDGFAGYNLIANPYPSYINPMDAINANANLEGTIWYRTRKAVAPYDYKFETVNTTSGVGTNAAGTGMVTGFIPPMQAFWVRTITDNQPFTFTNIMRDHARNVTVGAGTVPTTPLKAKTQLTKSLARIVVAGSAGSDEVVLYFDENASNSFDRYDSRKMFEGGSASVPEIFSVVGNEKLVINGLNTVSYDTEIPLGFNAKLAGDYSITSGDLVNFESGTQIILKDKLRSNSETTLTNGVSYNFNSQVTSNSDRFSLLFRAPGVTTGIDNATKLNAQVFVNTANQIMIVAPANSNYAIYNAMGQQIENGILNTKHETRNAKLNAGVYVVKVNNQSTRVIIK